MTGRNLQRRIRFEYVYALGASLFLLGLSAVTGHAADRPLLYGRIPGWSAGCALPTGVAFLLLGAAVVFTYIHLAKKDPE